MLKVLLVDDNENTLNGLKYCIDWKELDCEVISTAENGYDALNIARALLPNLVITDIRMPIIDGVDLIKTLRREMPGIHILILTAYDEFEYAKVAIDYGVDGYISKPIDAKKVESIRNYIRTIQNSKSMYSEIVSKFYDSKLQESIITLLSNGDHDTIMQYTQNSNAFQNNSFAAAQDETARLLTVLYNFADKTYDTNKLFNISLSDNILQMKYLSSKQALLDHFSKYLKIVCDNVKSVSQRNSIKIVKNIKTFIKANLADINLSPSYIADKFNISLSYLCSIFKKEERLSLNTFIITTRMQEVTELMKDRSLKISDISEKTGFVDRHYFSKVFKKYFNISPREYRANLFLEENIPDETM